LRPAEKPDACVVGQKRSQRGENHASEHFWPAALADAFHIQVASHGGGPGNLNMLAAMPNAIYLESGSLKGQSMYEVNLKMVDGEVLVPDVPGLGTAVRDDYIKKHRIG